jgi:hypothetical protein
MRGKWRLYISNLPDVTNRVSLHRKLPDLDTVDLVSSDTIRKYAPITAGYLDADGSERPPGHFIDYGALNLNDVCRLG